MRRRDWAAAQEGREEDDYQPDMPPLETGAYLVHFLYEIGPTLPAGMGAGPITNSELRDWQINVGIDLQPWEARCICRLSREYLMESHKATAHDRPSPWRAEADAEDFSAVAKGMQNALKDLAKL